MRYTYVCVKRNTKIHSADYTIDASKPLNLMTKSICNSPIYANSLDHFEWFSFYVHLTHEFMRPLSNFIAKMEMERKLNSKS